MNMNRKKFISKSRLSFQPIKAGKQSVLLFFCLCLMHVLSADTVWQQKTTMTVKDGVYAYACFTNFIYLFGGENNGSLTTVQKYDATNDSWTTDTNHGGTLAPLPEARGFGLMAATINNRIHVFGGWKDGTYKNDHFIYDPLANTWSNGPALPQYPIGQCCCTWDNKIYVFGGWWGSYSKVVLEYSDANGWQQKANMPTARNHATAAAIDNKIYVFGGESAAGSLDTVEAYDIAANTWQSGLSPMPEAQSYLGRCGSPVMEKSVYLIGVASKQCFSFAVNNNTWSSFTDLPESATGIGIINKTIYAMSTDYTFAKTTLAVERDNLIGYWSNSGIWIRDSISKEWQLLSLQETNALAMGDLNGDGAKDFIGSFPIGVWYRNSATGVWTKLHSSQAQSVAAGDIDGDGLDDLLGVWKTPAGVWVRYSKTGLWERLNFINPTCITSGKITIK
jgi:hypothetical protein